MLSGSEAQRRGSRREGAFCAVFRISPASRGWHRASGRPLAGPCRANHRGGLRPVPDGRDDGGREEGARASEDEILRPYPKSRPRMVPGFPTAIVPCDNTGTCPVTSPTPQGASADGSPRAEGRTSSAAPAARPERSAGRRVLHRCAECRGTSASPPHPRRLHRLLLSYGAGASTRTVQHRLTEP